MTRNQQNSTAEILLKEQPFYLNDPVPWWYRILMTILLLYLDRIFDNPFG